MLFNSPEYFFVFLPLAVVVYFLINRAGYYRAAKVWLVGASLYFYAYWNAAYLGLILASILVNYSVAGRMRVAHNGNGGGSKALLVAGVTFNLGLLGYFKYSDFFIANINALLSTHIPLLELLLPLAISFFTFQQIAYLVDCHRYNIHEYDFLNYCLFVSFFPQLIAGPIVHHREMMPQFMNRENAVLQWDNVARGVLLFSIGLFKKVVIADTFAIWADEGFANTAEPGFLAAWQTSLSYTFQLYYDFSGYTDMAIGAALMFNIHLPLNFNSPYKSLDIQDFWRRWHMTLSRWLRDYLYIPLGGNRRGPSRTYVNIFLTFLLGGLWHGAGWTFIIWGAMHGMALVIHRRWSTAGYSMAAVPAWILTFIFVNFAWVMFRAEDVDTAVRIMSGMAGANGFALPEALLANYQYWQGLLLEGVGDVAVDHLLGPVTTWCALLVFGLVAVFGRNSIQIVGERTRFGVLDVLRVGGGVFIVTMLSIAASSSVFLYFNF